MRTGQGSEERTTLCLIKRNRSLGSGAVRWTGSPIPFGAFIASHVQDLDIPEARGKSCKRKPVPAAAGQCGHISLMKLREWSSFIIREWSLFCKWGWCRSRTAHGFCTESLQGILCWSQQALGKGFGLGKERCAQSSQCVCAQEQLAVFVLVRGCTEPGLLLTIQYTKSYLKLMGLLLLKKKKKRERPDLLRTGWVWSEISLVEEIGVLWKIQLKQAWIKID